MLHSNGDAMDIAVRDGRIVDLTCQHKNQTLLVEGPEVMIRPVGTRRVTGGSR